MDIGMDTEFKVRLKPKDDKAVYSQNVPLPIHLKENLIVEVVLMHKYVIITVFPFSKYASPIFEQRNPNVNLLFVVDLRKINTLIADDYINKNHPASTLSDAAQHLAGRSLFCEFDCSQTIIVCRWRTNGQWKCLLSNFTAELLPTGDLHNVSADLCLPLRDSFASTWTQLSRLTIVLNTWTILEFQPIMLRISLGAFGQSSSAFAKQD